MRTTNLLVALAATLRLAVANVVCETEALHYKPRITTATERAGFAQSIGDLCSNAETDKDIQSRFESTLFTLSRTGGTFDVNDCKEHFNDIIDECFAGKNRGGGSFVTNAMTLKVSIDVSSKGGEPKAHVISKKSTANTPAQKKPLQTPAKTPKKPVPTPKATPKPTPAGKACALKPKNGKKPGKTLRSLASKIFGRASPAKPGSPSLSDMCLDEAMHTPPGWGETFFGVRDVFDAPSSAQLLSYAKNAYDEIMAKHPSLTILVAAVYVPQQGVYLGTVPHGAGMNKMKADCPATAPVLWSILGDRTLNDPTKSPSLYHAEDAAMWYAYQKDAVDKSKRFPTGSIMLTYGKVMGGGQAMKIPACNEGSKSNIDPHCEQTMKSMNIRPA